MAQNVTVAGASFSDVPSVVLPKTGGGSASFLDTTIASNAATASDIAQGKIAYVNGALVTGTASGGGATLITKSITANGTYNASSDNADGYSSVTVNVSGGGGGVEYESGTWTPSQDIAQPTISFQNTHATLPYAVSIVDAESDVAGANSVIAWEIVNFHAAYGSESPRVSTSSQRFGIVRYDYKTSSSTSNGGSNVSALTGTTASSMSYWIANSGFMPYTGSTTRYFRSNRTYKWLAVWAPSS